MNTPVYRASTFIWDSAEALEDYHRHGQDPEYRRHLYGRNGNPTTAAFEDAMAELEGDSAPWSCPRAWPPSSARC